MVLTGCEIHYHPAMARADNPILYMIIVRDMRDFFYSRIMSENTSFSPCFSQSTPPSAPQPAAGAVLVPLARRATTWVGGRGRSTDSHQPLYACASTWWAGRLLPPAELSSESRTSRPEKMQLASIKRLAKRGCCWLGRPAA